MKTTKKKQPPKSAGPSLFRDRVKGLVRLPADRIEVAAKNFRTHDDRQRAALDGVLSEVGIAGAAVAWVPDAKARAAVAKVDGPEAFAAWLASFTGKVRLIDGHLRRERLAAQGQPVLVTDLDEREAAKALATFDAVSDLAGVDPKLLASLLEDVGTPEHEGTVDLLGELRKHIPAASADDDKEEPVIPTDALVVKWGTSLGQLWVVPSLTVPGREHRLLCGDCRDPANVERLHEGRRPALGLHDPPYGVNAVNTTRETLADGRKVAKTRSSSKSFEPVREDDRQFSPVHLLGSSARLALWGANNYAHLLPPSAEWIMWSKRTGMAESTFSDGELAWVSPEAQGVGHVRGIWHTWSGANRASETEEAHLHPTQKPVRVQRAPIEWYSKPGDDVADWYMGAGAVIIACEQTGRIGHGMDIAPAYLAATLERLAARGLTPRLVQ